MDVYKKVHLSEYLCVCVCVRALAREIMMKFILEGALPV